MEKQVGEHMHSRSLSTENTGSKGRALFENCTFGVNCWTHLFCFTVNKRTVLLLRRTAPGSLFSVALNIL